MGGGTTPLTKANISKTTPRCSNNYTSYFLLERDVSKFEMLWAFIKIVLRMGDRAINSICLMHKTTLVWCISRNIFQPMGYAAGPAGYDTTKKYNKNIFLKHSKLHSAF